MNVSSAIQRRRTIRRFKNQPVPESILIKFVDSARLAPSAGNSQPLEYVTVASASGCEKIFPSLKWARFIGGGDTPAEDKKPAAYIIVLINRNIAAKGGGHESGAAVQNILLSAIEEGYGACWLRSVDRAAIKEAFGIAGNCDVDSVVALGKPAESPITELAGDDTKYWRDDRGLLHVPKRSIDTILHKEKY